MKKTFLRTACLILTLIFLLPLFSACTDEKVYKLGPYTIEEDEYSYLMGMHKKKLLESIGLDESYLNLPTGASNGKTYGEYIEDRYREEFEQSVYTLLFSQALFDEYGLELTPAQKSNISATANAIIYEFGGGSVGVFNDIAKNFGFSDDTLFRIYEKQAKESAVIDHLFGKGYHKLTDEQKEDYYKQDYIHFQVIIVNTLYKKIENSHGDIIYRNLTESERKTMLKLEEEISLFLCSNDLTYNYQLLPKYVGKEDVTTITYEDIFNCVKINDDMLYPQGYYMLKPSSELMQYSNTLSQALLTAEGDVSRTKAKRYFEGDGEITTEDGKETVKEGDYFEYGTAFVKRLPIDDGAWKREENKIFFEDSNFIVGAAQYAFFRTLQSYEDSSPYTLMVNNDLKSRYSLIKVLANELDYYYIYQKVN